MKKILFLSVALTFFNLSNFQAQTVFNFDALLIPHETGWWNGSDLSAVFGDSEIKFKNNYNTDYQSWSGFAFAYDTISVDKQYITHAGTANSGHNFGIGFVPSDWESGTYDNIPVVCSFTEPVNIQSIFATNNEYAADVIINGLPDWGISGFAEGDYFKLIIEGKNGNESKGFVEYFLADYRNGNTFVADTWNQIDLSSFGIIDSLKFNLESTDTGDYGMNTPAYFCIDDLSYSATSSAKFVKNTQIIAFPNPFVDKITISNVDNSKITVVDISGQTVFSDKSNDEQSVFDLSELQSGIYFLKTEHKSGIQIQKIVKR